jgi:prophage regulatory protein
MQKRLKASIWPVQKNEPTQLVQESAIDKLTKLCVEFPQVGYVRQALLIPGILPISSATLWRWVANGQFPKPVKLSSRITAWRVEDVMKWLRSQQGANLAH